MEYPKRLTAINPVTNALIKSRGDNQETYSNGWDAIWGKKTMEDVQEILDGPSILIPNGLTLEEMREFICGHAEEAKDDYYVAFNPDAKCSPTLTQCPRCNNPSNSCDQYLNGCSNKYNSKARAIVLDLWEQPEKMWEALDELEEECKE